MDPILRQVLVHVDPTAATTARLQVARRVAEIASASVAALYAVQAPADHVPLALARAAFDKAMAAPGPMPSWAEALDTPPTAAFLQQALFADLLVLGQPYASDSHAGLVPGDFVESVILESARPALVVPYVGWAGTLGETIAVAWKETGESARAVTAALPLLRLARRVHVVAWGGGREREIRGPRLDLDHWLRLHGVSATWHRSPHEPEQVGDLLLSRVFDLEADLLVMGCYGHSRARELVLGGASRTVLRSMTLPVLMAH